LAWHHSPSHLVAPGDSPGGSKAGLLHSALQIDVGAHRGAIAGWLDSGGNPVFVYPEIAGYYLTAMG
jgi:hypothetical protein